MEKEIENIMQRWKGKVALVKKAIETDSHVSQGRVLSELTEKYM
jgi:hypothetical protein